MEFGDFESLDGGLMFYALLGCLAAIPIGAAWWALGHYAASPHHAGKGKAAVTAALVGALLIGGGPLLVEFFTRVGARVITYNVDRSNGRIAHARIAMEVQAFCSCAHRRATAGEQISVRYEVLNVGRRPVAAVRVYGNTGPAHCAVARLNVDGRVVCDAVHTITAADLAAGDYTAQGTATGTADDGTVLSTTAGARAIPLQP